MSAEEQGGSQSQGGDSTKASGLTTVASHSRPISRRKRLVFVLVMGLGVWLICETGAFFLYWLVTTGPFSWEGFQNQRIALLNDVEGPKPNIVAEVHPYVGFVEKPRQESSYRRFADGRPMPVSKFGYVDDKEPIVARRADRIIIAILGGSVACHFAVNGVAKLGAELSRSPEFAGKELVFVNLALSGYKQPQQLMTLAYLLSLGAQFDLALNIDGFNEVALYELENSGRHIFPAFPRSWELRISSADPDVLITTAGLIANEEQRNDLARWYSRAPWRFSVLCNLYWEFQDRRLARAADGIITSYYRGQGGRHPYFITGPPTEFAGRAELYQHLAMIWANGSSLLDGLCRSKGIRYYHFLQPNQYVPGSKPMGDDEKRVAFNAEHPYRRAVETGYPLLIQKGRELQQEGIAYFDFTQIFSEHPEAIYNDDCCHFNQAGIDLMSQAIVRSILTKSPAAIDTSRPKQ
jgi:hypothetical protein